MVFRQDDINPIYERKVQEARKTNIRNLFNEKETAKKVKNFAERFGYDESLVWKRMQDDIVFALTFAKDPSKQSIHQHIAAEYIKQLPTISNFKELPAGGKNAKYCVDGTVKTGDEYASKTIKSIDFYWEYNFKNKTLCFYATHKHTSDEGGAQDNQFNDVISFHENAKKCKNDDIVFLSITDGAYYKKEHIKDVDFSGSRLQFLNDKCCGERSCATTSNGLLRKIIPYINKWLNDNYKDDSDVAVEQMKLAAIYDGALED